MSSKQILSYYAADDAGTNQLGSILGAHLKPGHIVLLEGGLGAGKSALARAIIRSVLKDHTLQIPSPTFLLVLPYQHGETSFLHADLYRLNNASEIEELGLFEDPETIVLIEWPERAPDLFRFANLIIKIEILPENSGREFTLTNLNDADILDGLKGTSGFLTKG